MKRYKEVLIRGYRIAKRSIGVGISLDIDQYSQPSIDILELRSIGKGRETGYIDNRNEQNEIQGQLSQHIK